MKENKVQNIKLSDKKYRVERPTQTGFSSPATHYSEPRIDLNDELVSNASATFFVRTVDDSFREFNVLENDVLIIDKSRTPKTGQLVLAIVEGSFNIVRVDTDRPEELEIWGTITYIIKSML
ncbi:MAG: S24 family peptidase [Maribacter sp.]